MNDDVKKFARLVARIHGGYVAGVIFSGGEVPGYICEMSDEKLEQIWRDHIETLS